MKNWQIFWLFLGATTLSGHTAFSQEATLPPVHVPMVVLAPECLQIIISDVSDQEKRAPDSNTQAKLALLKTRDDLGKKDKSACPRGQ
jgi:hypothetical protein